MKRILLLGLAILFTGCVGLEGLVLEDQEGPPAIPPPVQVSSAERTAGTETDLRSFAPADIASMAGTHGGTDGKVKVDSAATADYLNGAITAGTNVTFTDNGDSLAINASLAGGAVDTEGTLNADEIAVMHDLDTIKSLTEAEFKVAYNMEAGTDYLAQQTIGIADDNLLEVDHDAPADNDYAKFTANGIEGRSYAEVKSDLDLEIGTDVLAQQTIGIADDNLLEVDHDAPVDDDYAKFTANGLEGRSYAEMKSDLDLEVGTDVLAQQTIGIADDNLLEVDDLDAADNDYCKLTANGIEGRSYAEVLSDIGAQATVTEGSLDDSVVVSADVKDNTLTASDLAATLTMADGDLFDFSGITHTVDTDEGLVLPTWANVAPTSNKKFLAADGSNLKLYNGGWVTIGASAAPTDAQYLTLALDATLSAERVLTESTQGIDFTDAGANGTLTVSIDPTEMDAVTWSDGANASNVWTFDVSGTNHTMTAGDGLMTFGDAVTVTDTLTATNGIALGTSKSITGTTAITLGDNNQTIAINSSDWDISATGVATGMGNISSDGTVTGATLTDGTLSINSGAVIGLVEGGLNDSTIVSEDIKDGEVATADLAATLDLSGKTVTFGLESTDVPDISGDYEAVDAEILRADTADTISADLEFQDNIPVSFGNDNDWELDYTTDVSSFADVDDSVTGAGLAFTTNSAADVPVYFENTGDGGVDLYVKDIHYSGAITSHGTGDSKLGLRNNASYAGDNYELFVEGTVWKFTSGDTTEKIIANSVDNATVTGDWNFGDVTNFEIPNGNSTDVDVEGEIGIDTDDDQLMFYVGGSKIVHDYSGDSNGYVLKSNGSGVLTLQADATGGTTPWDSIGDPTGAGAVTIDGAGETTTFTMSADNTEHLYNFTGAFTTGNSPDLFRISQNTGAAQAVTLFKVDAADSDVIAAEIGNTTDYWQISQAGVLSNVSGATVNIAAADDLLIAGSQMDHDDMAGAAVVASTGGLNIDEDVDIDFNASDEEMVITNSAEYGANGAQVTIDNSDADVSAQNYLLNLDWSADDGQANADYIIAQDSGGTVWVLGQDGDVTTTDGDYTTTNGTVSAEQLTSTDDLTIADGGNIGSASDADAIAIAANGEVTLTQKLGADGGIEALTPVTDDPDNFAANFTGANLYGGTFVANAAGDVDLPEPVAGMNFTVITMGDVAVDILPAAGDDLLLDGVQLDDNHDASNTDSAGDIAVVQYYDADGWLVTTNGWTEVAD